MKSSVFEDTMTPRLDKLFWALTVALLAILSTSTATAAQPQSDRTSHASPEQVRHGPRTLPNIVYIALEDITPMMGCYGDAYARTPVFDKLANEGIRYTHAYSVGPVCSVSRSSIVTSMYPTTLGTMHHRSNVGRPPAFLEMIPNQMREAGYYTSNNAKTDYNIGGARWNESSKKAHWRNRPDKGQPFFAKFDLGECHSSITKIPENVIVKQRLNRLQPEDFHDPAKAVIPPFHPDVPMFRKAWSRYYDSVTQVDYRAGEIIDQLVEDRLWDDTIVIVWADHGVGMPRGKHTVFEQGTHVPLIVRYPKKYQHLAPAMPGSVLDDMICLMDMGPSVMKLAGIETPDYGDAVSVLSEALTDPMISARIRASGILDTQPPEASQALQPAIANLQNAAAKTNVKRLGGIPYGLNDPFGRAYKSITGQKNYYRWGMGASGSPKSPLMKVQESLFFPRRAPTPPKK